MSAQQQYCLRWNNHRSNLLTVFDQLLQNEAFTDVTLACEGGMSVKCHKMVLAACSSYFQSLFTELPCRHPVVVLKDVRYGEMKAILEYMYKGEVNVAQDQLGALLKVAEALKVKGLVEENGSRPQMKRPEDEGNAISTSTTSHAPPSSSVNSEESPPHSTGVHHAGFPKLPYLYGSNKLMGERSGGRMSVPMWPMEGICVPNMQGNSGSQNSPSMAMLNWCYESPNIDRQPVRRKKLPSPLLSHDTPILRTVLGQGQADSSQPVPLICRPDSYEPGNHSPFTNGSGPDQETLLNIKQDPSLGDAPSPYTDISNVEEENSERHSLSGLHSSQPHSMYGDSKGGISSAIATYVPTSKPAEWKRYKQYTRNDIMSAIEAVRRGMSAVKAAKKFGVPSRTLYDKVKKLGITTNRQVRRSSNSNGSPAFQYTSYGLDYGREAIAAMGVASNMENSGNFSSPGNNERSLSPNLIKYAHRRSVSPLSLQQIEEDSNQVEDLSITRKPEPPPTSRVIMPPMSQASTMVTTASDSQDNTD
ncbi:uncharacterized protein LOC106666678 isoform X2 [Cimex lectularius]|uniref:Uncharacterized protein n=1 Tax=Cimex lectularius TaxID=79782 RepID=A0A8I6RQ49_CIMLE|nr:uncharacterized protein LOC106666678 isoform X2 [Cimex lectularius]